MWINYIKSLPKCSNFSISKLDFLFRVERSVCDCLSPPILAAFPSESRIDGVTCLCFVTKWISLFKVTSQVARADVQTCEIPSWHTMSSTWGLWGKLLSIRYAKEIRKGKFYRQLMFIFHISELNIKNTQNFSLFWRDLLSPSLISHHIVVHLIRQSLPKVTKMATMKANNMNANQRCVFNLIQRVTEVKFFTHWYYCFFKLE